MKFSLEWLKQHLDTQASAQEIADKLTAIGLEVEGLSNPAEALAPVADSTDPVERVAFATASSAASSKSASGPTWLRPC